MVSHIICKYVFILQVAFSFCLWLSMLCKNFNYIPLSYFYFSYSERQIKISKIILCFPLVYMFSLQVTFRSLSHFQFIFIYDIRECFNFILLHVAIQFSWHHFLKRLLFSIVYYCPFCQRLIDDRYVGLFLGFQSSSINRCLSLCEYHNVLMTVAL